METAPPSTFYFWWNPLCARPAPSTAFAFRWRLVFACRDPRAQSLLMPSRTYQSCSFINSDRDPSVLTVVAGSTCGSWQETDALVRGPASLMRPLSLRQLAPPPRDWRLAQRLWHEPAPGRGSRGARSQERESVCLLTHKCRVWC